MEKTPLVLSVSHFMIPLLLSALTIVVSSFTGLPLIETLPLAIVGLLLLAVGFIVRYSALELIFRRNKGFQPKYVPENLITDGVFRHSRNPAYLGVLLMWTGAFLFGVNLLMAVAVMSLFVRFNGMASREEGVLAKQFGEAYASYKKKTRRWL